MLDVLDFVVVPGEERFRERIIALIVVEGLRE